ncbi:MAG TPA: lipopolysaccharide heptosyltransferase I [Desulfuromonadales bacterium]|nr:lipopolysaccharide heptosyltransferase I [Desulfuromonadales bacterium]
MKALIIKTSALGDVVHALPVLAWLKSAEPMLAIDWLVEEDFAPLLEDHPQVRQVIRLRTKAWRRAGSLAGLREAWRLIGKLRGEDYDIALDLQGNSKSGLFTLLSGAPVRYGYGRDGVREWPNLVATNRKVALEDDKFHITDRALAIARAAFPAGKDVMRAGPLPVDGAAAAAVEAQLGEAGLAAEPVVVLHYGTTWVTKLWPLSSWQKLAGRLAAKGRLKPVLTWGNDAELEAVKAIQAASNGRCLVWPRGRLKDLVALLARADLVVGGDTGPVHIAAAVGTPTVSIFRATDAARNAPRGEKHISLSASMDCAPCLRKSCDLDEQCGASISVDQVAKAVFASLPASFLNTE